MNSNQELFNLHYIRIVAILGIVLYHSSILLEHYGGIDTPYYYFKSLYAGVDYLFVLSGFLMFHLYHASFGSNRAIGPFLVKRVMRIYPLYMFITLSLLLVYFLFPNLGAGNVHNPIMIIKSLILWPDTYPILSVGWTLTYQVYFYVLFSTLLSRKFQTLFYFVMTMSVINLFFGWQQFWFNYYNLEFLLGILAALCWWKYHKVPVVYLLGIGFLLLAAAVVLDTTYNRVLMNEKRVAMYGTSGFFLTWGLATLRQRVEPKIADAIRFLSQASFAIFLSHYSILALLFGLFFSQSSSYFLIKWIASVIVAVMGGISLHVVIEELLLARGVHHIIKNVTEKQ